MQLPESELLRNSRHKPVNDVRTQDIHSTELSVLST